MGDKRLIIDFFKAYFNEAKQTPMAHSSLFLAWLFLGGLLWMSWFLVLPAVNTVNALEAQVTGVVSTFERQQNVNLLAQLEAQVRAIDSQLLSIERDIERARNEGNKIPDLYLQQRQRLTSEKNQIIRRITTLLTTYPYLVGST